MLVPRQKCPTTAGMANLGLILKRERIKIGKEREREKEKKRRGRRRERKDIEGEKVLS